MWPITCTKKLMFNILEEVFYAKDCPGNRGGKLIGRLYHQGEYRWSDWPRYVGTRLLPSTSDFSGEVCLNLTLGMVNIFCIRTTAAFWGPECCWLGWGSMSIGNAQQKPLLWEGGGGLIKNKTIRGKQIEHCEMCSCEKSLRGTLIAEWYRNQLWISVHCAQGSEFVPWGTKHNIYAFSWFI